MTKDEFILHNIECGNIIVDAVAGEVYATRGPGGRMLKEPALLKGTNNRGYKTIAIRCDGIKLQCRVHRIVWIKVHGIPPAGMIVDHKDNVKARCGIDNLQLLTGPENSTKAAKDGLYRSGMGHHNCKLSPLAVRIIRLAYSEGDTMKGLAKAWGVSVGHISNIVHGRRRKEARA